MKEMKMLFVYVYIVLFQVQEFEGKDTALLIDRYKYLDLFPCSQSELKALGYYVSNLVNQDVDLFWQPKWLYMGILCLNMGVFVLERDAEFT